MKISTKLKLVKKCDLNLGIILFASTKNTGQKVTREDVDIHPTRLGISVSEKEGSLIREEILFSDFLSDQTSGAKKDGRITQIALVKSYENMIESLKNEIEKMNKIIDKK